MEKASESANHENLILRAKVEKMSAELKEYKKRAALNQPAGQSSHVIMPGLPSYLKGHANHVNSINDVNFSFEFPKFGRLPGPPVHSKSESNVSKTKSPTTSPGEAPSRSMSFTSSASQLESGSHNSLNFSMNNTLPNIDQTAQTDMSQFSGLFTPTVHTENSDYMAHANNTSIARSSTDSTNAASSTGGHNTSHSSPASSNSAHGPSSSCGTSPEPYTQSPPASKLDNTLTTIGEEDDSCKTKNSFCGKLSMVCGSSSNPVPRVLPPASTTSAAPSSGLEIGSLDWFAAQNNNQFDPQLFGDYREPQDNILAGELFDDAFFNEAFAMPAEFMGSPVALEHSVAAGTPGAWGAAKRDLVAEIDEKLRAGEEEEVVPGESEMLTCTNMWYVFLSFFLPGVFFRRQRGKETQTNPPNREKIQACPRVQNGEIDMESLCTQLQQKAKCSGDGPVIQERDFKDVLNTMFTAKGLPPCDE